MQEMITLTGEEGFGNQGEYAILIKISKCGIDLSDRKKHKKLIYAGYEAIEKIKKEIMRIRIKDNPETQLETKKNKKILECFEDQQIYVEEIPNGYCKDWCCEHLPWFKVTTKVGHIIIGWRKRVINIDWSLTNLDKSSEELFPDNHEASEQQYIHVWNLEEAKESIEKLLTSSN